MKQLAGSHVPVVGESLGGVRRTHDSQFYRAVHNGITVNRVAPNLVAPNVYENRSDPAMTEERRQREPVRSELRGTMLTADRSGNA